MGSNAIMKKLLLICALFAASLSVNAKEYLVKTSNPEQFKNLGIAYTKVIDGVYKVYDNNFNAKRNLFFLEGVQHVEENQEWSIEMGAPLPKEDELKDLWGLKGPAGIKAEEAWKESIGSKKLLVAVIDTGIDYNHPDLRRNIWVNKAEKYGEKGKDDDGNGYIDDVYGYDFANNDNNPMDGHGHGTHCAGTIGAVHNKRGVAGVMKDVKLVALKFLSDRGSGTTEGAIKSIDYATKLGVHVMSNSWGGGGYSQLLKEAIERAEAKGIVFVAAAGNSGSDNDEKPHYPSNYDVSNVIAVASHTSSDKKSYFSCYGAETVDVSAPGSAIKSTWKNGGYKSISGTSMATPHVSGIVGLMLAKDKSLSPSEIKDKLIKSCVKQASFAGKTVCEGRVDAAAALK